MQVIDYDEIDWRGSWQAAQAGRGAIGDPSKWDARADSFANREKSPYAVRFVELLGLRDGETVLDMGCGTGELALLLAEQGHASIAVDFSAGMLSHLEAAVAGRGIGSIRTLNMSWTDDWGAHGIADGCVDVAFASRSIMVPDLGEALGKLSAAARRKAAVTLCTGASPNEDAAVLALLGRRSASKYDVPFCLNILFEMGYFPELSYIPSDKKVFYADADEAVADGIARVRDITGEEAARVDAFVRSHLVETDGADGKPALTLDYPRASSWAFISWDVWRRA